jgi:hypothetical protein
MPSAVSGFRRSSDFAPSLFGGSGISQTNGWCGELSHADAAAVAGSATGCIQYSTPARCLHVRSDATCTEPSRQSS